MYACLPACDNFAYYTLVSESSQQLAHSKWYYNVTTTTHPLAFWRGEITLKQDKSP